MKEEEILKFEKKLFFYLNQVDEKNKEKLFSLWNENREIMLKAPGSKIKHQSWKGGYLVHLVDTMMYAESMILDIENRFDIKISFSSAILVLFLHDLEKPWKYVLKHKFANEKEKKEFINFLLEKYKIILNDDEKNALKYIHGEGGEYSPDVRVQKPLAALCHAADNNSARISFDKIPKINF